MEITPQEGLTPYNTHVVYGVDENGSYDFYCATLSLEAARERASEACDLYDKTVIFELKVVETISQGDKKGG